MLQWLKYMNILMLNWLYNAICGIMQVWNLNKAEYETDNVLYSVQVQVFK